MHVRHREEKKECDTKIENEVLTWQYVMEVGITVYVTE
jgi:hypothetical protein